MSRALDDWSVEEYLAFYGAFKNNHAAVVTDDYVVFNTESCELEVLTVTGTTDTVDVATLLVWLPLVATKVTVRVVGSGVSEKLS